jgi:hypothetical protein
MGGRGIVRTEGVVGCVRVEEEEGRRKGEANKQNVL